MSEAIAEPLTTIHPAESRQRFSPIGHANVVIVDLAVKLGEFLQQERDRDLAQLESRGDKFKRVALMAGAAIVINKSGISQDSVASLIRAGEV